MICCGLDLFVAFPAGVTAGQRQSIIGSIVAECTRRRQFCGEFNPDGGGPDGTVGNPPIQNLYYNQPAFCSVECPDGNKFNYTIRAGMFLMPSLQQANYVAFQYACQQAKDHQICLSDLSGVVCAGTSFNGTIKAKGKYLAVYPNSDWWEIVDGTLPPGLVFHGGYLSAHQVLIDGTPTTAGVYTFKVRVVASTENGPAFGDYMEKEFTITVAAISPSTLPNGMIGDAYSQNLSVGPTHDQETETWTLTSGTLPAGLELTSAGILTGTPTGSGASYSLTFQVAFTIGDQSVTCSKAYTLTVEAPVTSNCPGSNTLNNLPSSVSTSDLDASISALNTFANADWPSLDPVTSPGAFIPLNESYQGAGSGPGGDLPNYTYTASLSHSTINCGSPDFAIWTLLISMDYNTLGVPLSGPGITYTKVGGLDPRGVYSGGASPPFLGFNPPATITLA